MPITIEAMQARQDVTWVKLAGDGLITCKDDCGALCTGTLEEVEAWLDAGLATED